MNDLHTAQLDMRRGYVSGAGGILASSLAWAAAAATAILVSPAQSVWVLFIGGMLIHPAGLVICKLVGASGGHEKANPLGALAGATTLWLIFSLPLVYVAHLQRMEWFFPAMLLVIGGRYLTFATIYGMRLYWALGLTLAGAAIALVLLKANAQIGAVTGSAIELVFAIAALVLHARWSKAQSAG
ncbi:MAG TPA: hypothetical protein VM915_00630 [Verrucomicrobiae bacterium]|nr:hypothetical protein [Verrucomicrobiae bacterium]